MIVVADTSPINYLIRLGLTDLLLHLYGQVLLPSEVLKELQNAKAPAEVKKWAENVPHWISAQTPKLSLQGFGLTVFGTLGVLRSAHKAQLIDGVAIFEKLSVLTNFYQSDEMRSAYIRSLTE